MELLSKEEEKEVNEKGKGKMETVDAMQFKRTRFGGDERMKEASTSQSQEVQERTRKKKKGPRQKINIDDFQMGRHVEPYVLSADVSKQGGHNCYTYC